MRRVALALLAGSAVFASLAGCPSGLTPTVSETLQLTSASTVAVHVRIATYKPGNNTLAKERIVKELDLAPRGQDEISLPVGKYAIDAISQQNADDSVVDFFTLKAGSSTSLVLKERLVDNVGSDKALFEDQRGLSLIHI